MNLFNFQTGTFTVTRGPIFCEMLLADEINRTPPKTQAALLEAMQERRITLDGKPHSLSERFMVVATENPIEQQGTPSLAGGAAGLVPLQASVLAYPSEAEERTIIAGTGSSVRMPDPVALGVQTILSREMLGEAIAAVSGAVLTPPIVDYVTRALCGRRVIPAAISLRRLAARRRHAGDGQPRLVLVLDGRDAMPFPMTSRRWRRRRGGIACCCRRPQEIDGQHIEEVKAGNSWPAP